MSSCIAAFVVQYCNQAGIDSSEMAVEIVYEKATKPAHLKRIAVDIHLPNADLEARIEAIKRVSSHCTVHEKICLMENLPINVYDKSAVAEIA